VSSLPATRIEPTRRPWARLRAALARPDRLVTLLLVAMFLLWGLAAARWHPLPQTDSLEQLLFAQHWQLAYAKHPPLPTWILLAVGSVVGQSVGLTFVLGASCAIAALAVLYWWARPLVGAPRAALATLLCSLVIYYNGMTSFYNHNTVQLPFTIAAIALFHAALASRRWVHWIGVGLAAGVLLTIKLTALLVFAALGLYVLYLLVRRVPLPAAVWLQMLAAGALAVAVAAAPLWALYGSNAAAGDYVTGSVATAAGLGRRLKNMAEFTGSVVSCVLLAALVFAALKRRAVPARPLREPPPLAPYLVIVGFAPLVLTLLAALLAGAHLLSPWGTTLVSLWTLWLVAASRWRTGATRRMLWRTALVALVLHVVLFMVLVFNHGRLPNLGKRYAHLPLATPALAQAVAQGWRGVSSAPLPPVMANIRTGAPMALGFRGTPLVVDGNRGDFDRVLPPAQRDRCGVIFIIGPVDPAAANAPTLPAAGTAMDPLDRAAWANVAARRFVPVTTPNTAGGTFTYLMTYQLPQGDCK
jgi:4-amino-4-deoxy-L-arabinose transferase-like glycosyltransferase